MSTPRFGEAALISGPIPYTTRPAVKQRLRPQRSVSLLHGIMRTAMIRRKSVMAAWTPVTVVFRSSVMSLIITFMFEPAKLQMNCASASGARNFRRDSAEGDPRSAIGRGGRTCGRPAQRSLDLADRRALGIAHRDAVLAVRLGDLLRHGEHEAPVVVDLLRRRLALEQRHHLAQPLEAVLFQLFVGRRARVVDLRPRRDDLVEKLARAVLAPCLAVGLAHCQRLPE